LYFVRHRDKKVVGVFVCVFRAPLSYGIPPVADQEQDEVLPTTGSFAPGGLRHVLSSKAPS
jgi:hypothetical protein